jgi:hypothetical protein
VNVFVNNPVKFFFTFIIILGIGWKLANNREFIQECARQAINIADNYSIDWSRRLWSIPV